MTLHMQWGALAVYFENEQFASAFLQRRANYFEFCHQQFMEGGVLRDEDILRFLAVRDKDCGEWRLDEFDSVEELLGAFLGYISGLLYPDDISLQQSKDLNADPVPCFSLAPQK